MEQNFIGKDGYYTFIGVVEDREDPLKLGRVRVRCYTIHSQSFDDIPTKSLPWAAVANDVSNGAYGGIGGGIPFLPVGCTVIGFFMDGNESQFPVVTGILAGITQGSPIVSGSFVPNLDVPDYPSFFTGESTSNEVVTKNKSNTSQQNSSERVAIPEPDIGREYPYNRGVLSESGHLIEIDDSPGKERLLTFHKSGSFVEHHTIGDVVENVHNNDYSTVQGEQYESVKGHKKVYLGDGEDILINGSLVVSVQNGNITINVTGDVEVNAEKVTVNASDINLGGEGGQRLARVGDRIQVGGGSSAGLWPIVEGSSISKSI